MKVNERMYSAWIRRGWCWTKDLERRAANYCLREWREAQIRGPCVRRPVWHLSHHSRPEHHARRSDWSRSQVVNPLPVHQHNSHALLHKKQVKGIVIISEDIIPTNYSLNALITTLSQKYLKILQEIFNKILCLLLTFNIVVFRI